LFPKVEQATKEFFDLGGPNSAAAREMLADAWIRHDHLADTQNAHEITYWSVFLLSQIAREDPASGWLLITDLLPRELPPRALYALAGKLQDLIACHGSVVLPYIESQAPTDPRLRDLLGGVWRDEELECFWPRIAPLRGEPWRWDPHDS
jgi:hypothetical protein